NVANRHALLSLLQDERFLRVRELARLHGSPLLSRSRKSYPKLQLRADQFRGNRAAPLSSLI
ncbi:MAG: hypothetical protein AAGI88_25790, partial [Pseudomonadota bacterium]